jgi:5-methyltetrahydropteroyltriglutamate--homocysteine methyltransferase
MLGYSEATHTAFDSFDPFTGAELKYVAALADAMKTEYQAIAQSGFTLQVDCPDLAMSRHHPL